MGTVPIGTGALRKIHSRVSWMFLPVERSITVSAPQRIAQTIFSTSSSIEEVTAELPMFALILTRKLRPITIGSLSGWLTLAGRIARPRAISVRTSSASTFSRIATNSISGVTTPFFAQCIWVALPRQRRTRRARLIARSGRLARRRALSSARSGLPPGLCLAILPLARLFRRTTGGPDDGIETAHRRRLHDGGREGRHDRSDGGVRGAGSSRRSRRQRAAVGRGPRSR